MIKIYFDGYELHSDFIRSLSQEATLFSNSFKLGSTLCRVFKLEVDKKATEDIQNSLMTNDFEILQTETLEPLLVSTEGVAEYQPQVVRIENENEAYATLYVDEFNSKNDKYYQLTLVDKMIFLNKEFEFDTRVGYTVKQLVEQICANHDISLVNTNFYLEDMPITWTQEGMTERDFISYVAEVNGGYAYIDENENLVFAKYSSEVKGDIDVEKCSSFTLGNKHTIDRVYVELGTNTHYYPETSDNETLYLNPNNILLTDLEDESLTIQQVVEQIYSFINGFTFYNITSDRCPLTDAKCGELINFNLGDETYQTICQIDYKFNGHWFGGYKLELDSSNKQETKIVSVEERIKKDVSISVDRQLGVIRQQISDVDEKTNDKVNVSTFAQLSDRIEMDFVSKDTKEYQDLTSHIQVDINGINISGSSEGEENATNLQLSSDGAYIRDKDGNEVTSMTTNTFRTGRWVMQQTNNGNTFNIFKEHN